MVRVRVLQSHYRFNVKVMLTTILEVTGLIAIIVVPMRGPKKKKVTTLKVDTDVSHAHYAVNEEGNIVEIHGSELTSHAH